MWTVIDELHWNSDFRTSVDIAWRLAKGSVSLHYKPWQKSKNPRQPRKLWYPGSLPFLLAAVLFLNRATLECYSSYQAKAGQEIIFDIYEGSTEKILSTWCFQNSEGQLNECLRKSLGEGREMILLQPLSELWRNVICNHLCTVRRMFGAQSVHS